MASANLRHTVAEILDYLDDNFDIPDDGVNSDIEGLDEEDFDEENNLLPEVAVSEDEVDEDVDLAALDIEENTGNVSYVHITVFCNLNCSFFIACQLSGFAGLRDMSRHMTKC